MEKIFDVSKKVARFLKIRLGAFRPSCMSAAATEDDDTNEMTFLDQQRTFSGPITVTRIASCSLPERQLKGVEAALEELSIAEQNFTIPAKRVDGNEKNEIDGFITSLVASQKRIQEKLWSPRQRKLRWQKAFAARCRLYDMLERKFGEEFMHRANRNVYGD